MTITGVRCLALAIVVFTGTLIFSNNYGVSAPTCQISVPSLIIQCSKFVSKSGPKVPPTPGCCSLVKAIDVKCACHLVTKEVENMISMEKAVYVARTCGLDVPKGMKCGSKSFNLFLFLFYKI